MITSEWPDSARPYAVPFIVRQVEFLRRAGVDVDVFYFRGGGKPSNYFRAWRKVHKRLKNEYFDLVHAQWGQSGLLALPKIKPLVITFRGDDVNGILDSRQRQTPQGIILKCISRYMAYMADECIVVSPRLAAQLPLQRCHIIPSGINLEVFRPLDKKQAQQLLGLADKNYLLFVGNSQTPNKRFSLVEEAVKFVEEKKPNVELILASQIAHEKIPLYMNACDVLVLASVHEGSPNVVKEALACNLPVVSTDVGDVRERIGFVEGCVVCDDDRPETLAAGILSVLSRNKRIDGRKTVLDLDETILTQKLISVYKKAIEGK